MANDWIPMRIDLPDDPDVMGIADSLGIRREQVVGHLLRLWGWASTHTRDGRAQSATDVALNAIVFCEGFVEAVRKCGWLGPKSHGIEIAHFERHLAQSAKTRMSNTKRQQICRASRVTKARPQNRTEQNKKISPPTPPRGKIDPWKIAQQAMKTDVLKVPAFADAWHAWVQYHKQKRHSLTKITIHCQIAKMEGWGLNRAIAALERSMFNGWTGVFEPDAGGPKQPATRAKAPPGKYDS